jgi:hypothetical protein
MLRGPFRSWFLLLAAVWLCPACRPAGVKAPTLTPFFVPTATSSQSFFLSDGGGEPRSPGYWLLWNSCAPDNRSETARSNGGREAGWIIVDDLLEDPGILVGMLNLETCPQAVNLLNLLDLQGTDRATNPAYQLAQAMLAAQLNLAAGAEDCPAADEAVRAGQLLLISVEFNGTGDYAPLMQPGNTAETAVILIEQLQAYNSGQLCR